ncbi:electron transfer flavoprotein beta subunit lysine methyltransferase-like [Argonauta hians]
MNFIIRRHMCFYTQKHWRNISLKKFNPKTCVSFFTSNQNSKQLSCLIKKVTEISTDHLTPEIKLRLITPNCYLWHSNGEECPFPDPFWAFYWPGGQSLARFLLDNKQILKNRSVVDLGSGCGALAIVSKLLGASHVVANDIDLVAIAAIKLNCELNNVSVNTDNRNLFHTTLNSDVVLLGDMLYDETFSSTVCNWLKNLPKNTLVLIGDPGRSKSHSQLSKMNFKKVEEYVLTCSSKLENYGIQSSSVWMWKR